MKQNIPKPKRRERKKSDKIRGRKDSVRANRRRYVFAVALLAVLAVVFGLAGTTRPEPELVSQSGSSDSWVWVRDTVTGTFGEAVVGTGTDIYIARGTSFYRYRPADNSLTELAAPPQPDGAAFKTGAALAWERVENCIYALYGAANGESRRYFYRYNLLDNTWDRMDDTPVDQGEGDAMVWTYPGPGPFLYATIGGEQRPTYLYGFDFMSGMWVHWDWLGRELEDPPAGMGDGASLVDTGSFYLYALRGEFYETSPLYDFWRYDMENNTWTVMADIPAEPHSGGSGGVGDGGSLLYVGQWLPVHADYIYALSGNQAEPDGIPDNRTYRYTISTNTWERLADLPFGVGYYVGSRLGYADGNIYAWQGAPSTWDGGGDDLAKYRLPLTHDVAVTNVTPSRTVVHQGYSVAVNVTVENQGEFTETFNVTAYANTTIIDSSSVTLDAGSSTTLTFTWNPWFSAPGNYTISAEASVVPYEQDTADNSLINGTVQITHIAGDLDGDGDVDIDDLYIMARNYGKTKKP
jgi:hypothetical protein